MLNLAPAPVAGCLKDSVCWERTVVLNLRWLVTKQWEFNIHVHLLCTLTRIHTISRRGGCSQQCGAGHHMFKVVKQKEQS